MDGITAVVGELNALDIGSTAVGTAVASKAVILDSSKDYTGIRNLTISGEIDAATGDYSGAVDIAGATTTAAITASGIIKTDDTTAATSTTDGSLQTDGGLSVALDAVIGDDLIMLSDASVIHFGANSEITLTHVHDVGLALKHTATADDKPIILTLQTGETDMAANDVMGAIRFQAPDEGTGTDAILVAAAIQAVSEGDFSSSNNATRLEFHTGASEAASSKMTLSSAGLLTITDDFVIKDNGTIGSASVPAAIKIGSDGDVHLTQDLRLQHDGAVLQFGADDEVTLTHVHNTGLLINGNEQFQFRDSALNIGSPSDGKLVIAADDELEVNSTLIDINGNVDISGTLAQADAITMATNKKIIFRDSAIHISSTADGDLSIAADDEIDLTSTLIDINGNVTISGTTGAAALTTSTIVASGIIKTDDTTAATSTTDGSLQTDGGLSVVLDAVIGDDIILISDAAQIAFGVNSEITLAHVHNTGLLLTDSGGTPTLQFHDSNESISSDGGHLIFTSNGVSFDFPSADGNDGQALVTNGSGVFSFADAGGSAAADDLTIGDAAVLLTTSSGNITIDAAANDSDIIFKGTDGGADLVFATIDGSAAGKTTFNDEIVSGAVITSGAGLVIADAGTIGSASDTDAIAIGSDGDVTLTQDLELQHDGAILSFGANDDVTLTHVHNTGLILNAAMVMQFRDSAINIGSPADGDLDINADDEIELNSTLIDVNGNLDVSGTGVIAGALTSAAFTASGIIKTDDTTAATSTTDGSLQTDGGLSVTLDAVIGDDLFMLSDAAVVTFGADKDVTLTHVADTGLLLNAAMVVQFRDSAINIGSPADGDLDINADDEIELNSTLIDVNGNLDVSGTIVGAGAITGGGLMTTGGNIVIPNAGNIGSAGDTDSIAIASNGVVTFSQAPVFPDGSIAIADLDIDGGTDIGAAIVDADLFIVDDGAGGTNRKATAARLKTYINAASAPVQLLIKDVDDAVIAIRVGLASGGTDVEIQNSAGTALKSMTGAFIDADAALAA